MSITTRNETAADNDGQTGNDQGEDDELPPFLGERYRDVLYDINHAANNAANQ